MTPIIESPKYIASRWKLVGYFLALATLICLFLACLQLWNAYWTTGLFDVDQYSFVLGSVIFLLAGYAAISQLDIFFKWLGFRYRANQQIVIAEYKLLSISPAEAGVLIDNIVGKNELIAALRSLESQEYLRIAENGRQIDCLFPVAETSFAEATFFRGLTASNSILNLPQDADQIREAYVEMRRAIQARFFTYITSKQSPYHRIHIYIRNIGIACELLFISTAFDPQTYQVAQTHTLFAWQLLFIIGVTLLIVLIPTYHFIREAFFRRDWDSYQKVAGLYLFLKVAYGDRLKRNGLSESERRYFTPYAQAFGLVKVIDDPLYKYL